MMKIKKLLLGAITALFPVVLAACYGPPCRYVDPPQDAKACRAVDGEKKAGIPGIQASCVSQGAEQWRTLSDRDGVFRVVYSSPCESLRIEDVDGEENGGYYGEITVDFPAENEECTYELNKSTL